MLMAVSDETERRFEAYLELVHGVAPFDRSGAVMAPRLLAPDLADISDIQDFATWRGHFCWTPARYSEAISNALLSKGFWRRTTASRAVTSARTFGIL